MDEDPRATPVGKEGLIPGTVDAKLARGRCFCFLHDSFLHDSYAISGLRFGLNTHATRSALRPKRQVLFSVFTVLVLFRFPWLERGMEVAAGIRRTIPGQLRIVPPYWPLPDRGFSARSRPSCVPRQ